MQSNSPTSASLIGPPRLFDLGSADGERRAEPPRREGWSAYPPLSELGETQRRESHEALLDADGSERRSRLAQPTLAAILSGRMSREQSVNIEQLVRAAYSALNRRDLDAFKEVIDPQVEFTSLIAEAEAETYRGHAGVSRWWQSVVGAFDDVRYELGDVRAFGDQVITETHIHAMLSGVEVEQTMWQVLLIRNERAVSWTFFRTEREALEALAAAGVSE